MKRFALVCLSLILRAGTALAAFTIFSGVAVGGGSDPTANVLPSYNDAYANWNNAGLAVIGGIPSVTTQCGSTVTPSGITPPAKGDDASKIQAAIKACAAGQFVQLGAGTFQLDITENIWLNKGIVLRGTGSCTNASSPYCSTVINTYNGPLANYVSPAACGVSGAGTTCPNPAAGLINVGPASGAVWIWLGWLCRCPNKHESDNIECRDYNCRGCRSRSDHGAGGLDA